MTLPQQEQAAKRGRRFLLPLALATLSGVLFAVALPPRNVEWVGWFAFVPLLIAVRLPLCAGRLLPRFCLGLFCGIVCGIVQIGWSVAGASALQFAYLPYVWIAIVIGLVVGFAPTTERETRDGGGSVSLRNVLAIACAGVAVEWLTTLSPLPVGIALCQNRTLPVIQIADATGIWGVSFLLWLVNAALADAISQRRRRATPLAVAGGALALTLVYGAFRLPRSAEISTAPVTVAAIQDYAAGDSAGFGTTIADATSTPEKEDLIRQAAKRGAKLIVGTEEAWGSGFRPNDAKDEVAGLARETRTNLVVGFSQDGPKDADGRPWNSAALVAPDGATIGMHHKIRLFLGERQTVRAGERAHAFPSAIGRVGLLICFDSCYTDATRQAVSDGAQIVAMPNFDPPTPRAVVHELHAALIPFRAVENRVAFVRADPTGLSQIVAPDGRIVAESPMRQAEALVTSVHLGDGHGTFFTRWGDWFAYLCIAVTLALSFAQRKTAPARSAKNADTAGAG